MTDTQRTDQHTFMEYITRSQPFERLRYDCRHEKHIQSLLYLASPYSHPDPTVQATRVQQIQAITAKLVDEGFIVFSPVLYTTRIADTATPRQGWYTWTLNMLAKSDILVIAQLEGWKDSIGIGLEIAYALGKGIPIYTEKTK